MTLKLSVLDQSVAAAGRREDLAIQDTLALAPFVESLGYHRLWLSEHHSLPTIVGTAPEVLLAALAARTSRIRLGSAGVMLPHYSALKVSEQFRVLEALAPGRIDLGVGRAPGGDMRTALALNPDAYQAAERFPEQIRDLQAWTQGEPHRGITARPLGPHRPEVWVLGSSNHGAQLAAHFGLPYAYAYFFVDGQGADTALQLYRDLYRPSERHLKPQATVCVWALAADSEEEALHQSLSRDRWRVNRQRGQFGGFESPDVVKAQGFSDADLAVLAPMRQKAFVGTARQVGDKLRALADDLALDEIVVNTWAYDPAVKRRSYELLAHEFDLTAANG